MKYKSGEKIQLFDEVVTSDGVVGVVTEFDEFNRREWVGLRTVDGGHKVWAPPQTLIKHDVQNHS